MSGDGSRRCADCAIALGHLGVLAEALSGGVHDWEARLLEGEQADQAQQAAHIRGLLARAAQELDELAAVLADAAGRAEDGGEGAVEGHAGIAAPGGRRRGMPRPAHRREEEDEAAVSEARWQDATVADEELDEAEAEADLAEAASERWHRRG